MLLARARRSVYTCVHQGRHVSRGVSLDVRAWETRGRATLLCRWSQMSSDDMQKQTHATMEEEEEEEEEGEGEGEGMGRRRVYSKLTQ